MQGIDLVTEDGSRLGFAWAGQFHLQAFPNGLGSKLNGHAPANASNHDRWADRIGHRITSVQLDNKWNCDAIIRFENVPPIWLAARYDLEPFPLEPCGDDLIVAFDIDTARKLGLSLCDP